MPLIVDTYNVLHVVGVLPPEEAGIDLPGLIRLIQHSRYRDERVELICDGTPREDVPPGKRRATIVRYSGPTRKADDVIAQMIRASSIPKRLTVVSSDHAVVRAARRRRCRILASDDFLRQLANDVSMPVQSPVAAQPPSHISRAQLQAWQEYFGVDDEALESLEAEAERENRARLSRTQDQQQRSKSGKKESKSSSAQPISPSAGSNQPLFPKELIEEAERLARQLDRLERVDQPSTDHSERSTG